MLIDNCTSHTGTPSLGFVAMKFLPSNNTLKLQLLDQGIIKNFKVIHFKEVVKKSVVNIKERKQTVINILDTMRMADNAWKNVSQSTIINFFKTCGFVHSSPA